MTGASDEASKALLDLLHGSPRQQNPSPLPYMGQPAPSSPIHHLTPPLQQGHPLSYQQLLLQTLNQPSVVQPQAAIVSISKSNSISSDGASFISSGSPNTNQAQRDRPSPPTSLPISPSATNPASISILSSPSLMASVAIPTETRTQTHVPDTTASLPSTTSIELDFEQLAQTVGMDTIQRTASSPKSTNTTSVTIPPVSKPMFNYVNPFHLFTPQKSARISSQDKAASLGFEQNDMVVQHTESELLAKKDTENLQNVEDTLGTTTEAESGLQTTAEEKEIPAIPPGYRLPQISELTFDCGEQHLEGITKKEMKVTPIALVPSIMEFNLGKMIAANKEYIGYAFKDGKIRIISQPRGTKALLRGHKKAIVDLAFAPHNRRLLSSIGKDNRFIVWKLEDPKGSDIVYTTLIELSVIATSEEQFRLKRILWHPLDPNCLALVTDDGFWILNLDQLLGDMDKVVISETDTKRIFKFSDEEPLNDLAFSPDGSMIVTASSGTLKLYYVKMQAVTLIYSFGLSEHMYPLSSIIFASMRVLISSSDRCKNIQIWDISDPTKPTLSQVFKFTGSSQRPLSRLSVKSTSSQSREDVPMFNLLGYDSVTRSLVVANSARMSVFSLRLSNTEDGKPVFDFMVEMHLSSPMTSFIVTRDLGPLNLYATQIQAVHAFALDEKLINPRECELAPVLEVKQKSEGFSTEHSKETNAQSLENTLSKPTPDFFGSATTKTVAGSSLEPEETAEPETVQSILTAKIPTTARSKDRSKKSSKAIAKKEETAKEGSIASDKKDTTEYGQNSRLNEDTPSPSETRSHATDTRLNSSSTPLSQPVTEEAPQLNQISKELRKMEDSVASKVAKMIQKEMARQHQRHEEERAARQVTEDARHEAILKVVSETLSNNTGKLLEQVVRDELQATIIPSLNKVIEGTVERQLAKSLGSMTQNVISSAIDEIITDGINKAMLKPTFTELLSKSIQQVLPLVFENTAKESFAKVVLPSYERAANAMFQQLNDAFQTMAIGGNQDVQPALLRIQTSIDKLNDSLQHLQSSLQSIGGLGTSSNSIGNQLAWMATPEPKRAINSANLSIDTPASSVNASSTITSLQSSKPIFVPLESDYRLLVDEINHTLARREYDQAFKKALQTGDQSVILWLCSRINPSTVFISSQSLLSQTILLSLLHLLSKDFSAAVSLRLAWIKEILLYLNPVDPVIHEYCISLLPPAYSEIKNLYYQPTDEQTRSQILAILQIFANIWPQSSD